jgi:transcriptional regulator GlxA family with amidase domain
VPNVARKCRAREKRSRPLTSSSSLEAMARVASAMRKSRARLARARTMIAQGVPLSETAAATGFADQSHLTRHFAARFGLTPGRWAALSRGGA